MNLKCCKDVDRENEKNKDTWKHNMLRVKMIIIILFFNKISILQYFCIFCLASLKLYAYIQSFCTVGQKKNETPLFISMQIIVEK